MFSLENLLVFPQGGAGRYAPQVPQGRAGGPAPHASRRGRMKEPTGSAAGMAEQRREQMLRAALEVIIERGYPDTRVTDVAERAGTSPALVIYYFKTRDQL